MADLPRSVIDRATVAKLKIESNYQAALQQVIERNQRLAELEQQLKSQHCSDEKRNRQLQSLGRKESGYLRLRRTRLGLDDFQTIKVIGKGKIGSGL
ncbi:hypothetical protein BDB01DRAFT_7145 [Pilobolus umbonatus]|nr:hypothetical protein BDB01DRAFT_7145 [Pilobolus umbonatus]